MNLTLKFFSHENVITRKAPRRIHGSDCRPMVEVIIRVPPARSYNAGTGRAGLGWLFCGSTRFPFEMAQHFYGVLRSLKRVQRCTGSNLLVDDCPIRDGGT
jgi:hypothetical protein